MPRRLSAESAQREEGPPALPRATPDVVEQAVVDGLVGVLPFEQRKRLERIARQIGSGHRLVHLHEVRVGIAHAREVRRARAGGELVQ